MKFVNFILGVLNRGVPPEVEPSRTTSMEYYVIFQNDIFESTSSWTQRNNCDGRTFVQDDRYGRWIATKLLSPRYPQSKMGTNVSQWMKRDEIISFWVIGAARRRERSYLFHLMLDCRDGFWKGNQYQAPLMKEIVSFQKSSLHCDGRTLMYDDRYGRWIAT